LTPTKRAVSDR